MIIQLLVMISSVCPVLLDLYSFELIGLSYVISCHFYLKHIPGVTFVRNENATVPSCQTSPSFEICNMPHVLVYSRTWNDCMPSGFVRNDSKIVCWPLLILWGCWIWVVSRLSLPMWVMVKILHNKVGRWVIFFFLLLKVGISLGWCLSHVCERNNCFGIFGYFGAW